MAGSLTVTLSLMEAMDSSVMSCALRTAHASFCPTRIAPISRMTASLLGKKPTTLMRRFEVGADRVWEFAGLAYASRSRRRERRNVA